MTSIDLSCRYFGCAVVLLVAGLCATARAETNLVFGVYPSDKPSAMVQQLRPTLDVLERRGGELLHDKLAIKMEVLRDYDTGVDVLTSGKIDFARLGAASYVTAKDAAPGIEILAADKKNLRVRSRRGYFAPR